MSQLVLEVIDGYHLPITVGSGEKTRHKQKLYMHNGGAFPIETTVSINSPADALPIGKYFLGAGAFRRGKYGDVELNNWEIRANLLVAQPAELKKVG